MTKLVEQYKAILNELMSMDTLELKRGWPAARDQAIRDRDRLNTYLKTRKPGQMTPEKIERFTAIANTRLPSLSYGPSSISIDRDKADRQVPAYDTNRVPNQPPAFRASTPQTSNITSAAIWLPGKSSSADSIRQFAHTRVDDLRKLARKNRPPIVRPPAPPDA
jgi:hypothetical protein